MVQGCRIAMEDVRHAQSYVERFFDQLTSIRRWCGFTNEEAMRLTLQERIDWLDSMGRLRTLGKGGDVPLT